MQLHKLTRENEKYLNGREICCVGKSESYIRELCDVHGVSDRISCIVDGGIRSRGAFYMQGREIPVEDAQHLEEIRLSDKALVITDDYYQEKYEMVKDILGTKCLDMPIYYFANKETECEEVYRNRYRELPLENIILFRSGPHAASYVKGMDFADNARALFEYMLEQGYNDKYELVWLVKNPESEAFADYRKIKNVSFVSFDWSVSEERAERDSYYRVLCLAKYIFFTDAYGFARNCRSDQIRVQLWHGCGFKTRVNFVRCEKRYEYMTVTGDLYAEIYKRLFGLREDQMLITGYAKADWVFHPAGNLDQVIGIPKAKKYIFWLPTFRSATEQLRELDEYELAGQTGLPIVENYGMLERLSQMLEKWDMVMILKLHPFQDRSKIGSVKRKNIVMLDNEVLLEKDIQINQLIGAADAMISDYSSAAVDYMLLDRPIAFTLDDMESYERSRGFMFEDVVKYLPGKELYTFEQFCDFVREVGEGVDSSKEKRRQLAVQMHRYHDDKSSERIVKELRI